MSDKDELANWPRCGYQDSQYLCTEKQPMPKGAPGSWRHTKTHEVGEQEDGWPSGDIVTMECKNCGQKWRSELPQ